MGQPATEEPKRGEVVYDNENPENGALVEVQQEKAVSLLDTNALMMQANKFKRDVPRVIQNTRAICCLDAEAAQACFYSVPRAGKKIHGPSIGLAETLASMYGNLIISVDHFEIGDEHVIVRGWIHDIETNLATQDMIRRRITTKEGKRYNDDMITTTVQAARSILYRNLVLRVIPRPIVKRIYNEAREVAMGKGKTHEDRQRDLVTFWDDKGVDQRTLLSRIDRIRITDITIDDMEFLLGVWQAIQAEEITIEEAFLKVQTYANYTDDEEDKGSPPADMDELNEQLNEKKKKSKPKDEPTETPTAESQCEICGGLFPADSLSDQDECKSCATTE